MTDEIKQWAVVLLMGIVAGIVMFAIAGCKQVRYVERARADSVYVVRTHRDSVYVKDSVSYLPASDTTPSVIYRYREVYRQVCSKDTVTEAKVDTVVRYVEKPSKQKSQSVSWWAAFMWLLGFPIFGFILAWIARALRRA